MVSIFTSPKKLVIESQVDPLLLVQAFRERITEDNFVSRLKGSFSFSGTFLGKVDGRNLEVRCVSSVHNSLEPTMHVQIDSAPSGGSVVRTRYSSYLFVKLFWILWMSVGLMISTSLLMGKTSWSDINWFAVCFPLAGVLVLVLMRVFARCDENRLETLVRNVIDSVQS